MRLVAAAAVAFAGLGLHAAPATLAQQQTPTFRAGVELVTVDVVVTDDDDRPITDLTIDDFEIRQDGRPQTITDFAFMGTPAMARDINSAAQIDAPAADVVTNTPPPRSSRLFAVIIDDLHLIETDVAAVQQVLRSFLSATSPADMVALTFTSRSDLAQDFTNDIGRLLDVVERIPEAIGFGHDTGTRTLEADHPDYLSGARSTAFVLRNATHALATSDQARRSVVLVSGGLSIDSSVPPCRGQTAPGPGVRLLVQQYCSNTENDWAWTLRSELEDVYESAARAGVPIYTLDPRGLVRPETALRNPLALADPDVVTFVRHRIRVQQHFLSEVAINTGGRAFTNRSNLTEAVNELVTDNGSYYLLGYYPEPFPADGEFHEIDVKVNRDDIRVRARSGYVAADPATRPAEGRPMLNAELGNIRPAGDIALRAFAAPLSHVDGRTRTAVVVEAAYPPSNEATPVQDELLMSVLAVDPDGRTVAESHRRVTLAVPPAGPAQPRVIALGDLLAIPDGRATLRIGIASRALGETATVYLPVDVPDLSDGQVKLGGLVIGSATRRSPPIASPAGLQAVLPFQPTLSREFATAETLRVFARLRWDIDEGEPAVAVTLRGDATVITSDTAMVPGAGDDDEREGSVDTTLALADVPPGPYVLEFTATLPNGDSVSRRVAIEVRR